MDSAQNFGNEIVLAVVLCGACIDDLTEFASATNGERREAEEVAGTRTITPPTMVITVKAMPTNGRSMETSRAWPQW
jgi:hypothetical protein